MEIVWFVMSLLSLVGLRLWLGYFKQKAPFVPYVPSEKTSLADKVKAFGFSSDVDSAVKASLKDLSGIGWSDYVLRDCYLTYLSHEVTVEEVSLLEHQARRLGSPLFLQMWAREWLESSPEIARHLLMIALNTVGLDKELTQLAEDIEDYLSAIAPIAPDNVFWQLLARVVQIAFPGKSLAKGGQLARRVHQLRYVISLQQTLWIRREYGGGRSDREALLAYLADKDAKATFCERLGLPTCRSDYDLRESARLHNKLAFTKEKVPVSSLAIPNIKILVRFHSELILDAMGYFANILDGSENGVVNGASFNYANRNGRRHWELDILPVRRLDPAFRKQGLKTSRYRYYAPIRASRLSAVWQQKAWLWSYFNPKGHYAQDKMSLSDLVTQQRKRFAKELRARKKTGL